MRPRVRLGVFVAVGVAVALALALALVVSPHASRAPDGLDRVAIDHGLDREARAHPLADLPTAGYGVDTGGARRLGTGAAGVVGVAATFALASGVLRLARRRTPHPDERVGQRT